ncbi:MAG: AsnC family transcriptional regulator [Bacteroidetes bacterium QH_7_62_13]|nr:MAG: AsnC family transcriptional regulator [Bacteroidetes bacterium QH_7_62_13]
MVTAIVLLNTERDTVNTVADALADLDGVSEVHSVAGRVDLVAILRVPENDELADLVTDEIRQIGGITDTETLIGFRVHSSHDLENMFSIGMD